MNGQYRRFQQKLYRRNACIEGMNAFLRCAQALNYNLERVIRTFREDALKEINELIENDGVYGFVPLMPDPWVPQRLKVASWARWLLEQPEFNNGKSSYLDDAGRLKQRVLKYTPSKLIEAFLRDPRGLREWDGGGLY